MKIVCAAAILVVAAFYLVALWQPGRQLRLHQAHFFRALEKRDWERVHRFIAEDYSDRWGHDKEFVLRESREILRQFLFLKVRHELREVATIGDGAEGSVSARVTLEGSGGPLAEIAKAHVASLSQPFVFRWVHRSWKPWDWKLREIDQSELELPEL
jgi:hypothetical protein